MIFENWSIMYSFDASSIILAWDNYPIENPHFESLWQWLAEQFERKEFVISKVAFDEVSHKVPECGEWLKNNHIEAFPLTVDSLSIAQKIKTLLDIEEEKYRGGVGENDLFIIAISKETDATLVSDEKRQIPLPQLKPNYKIPAVCAMQGVDVECVCFTDLLK